MPVASSPRVFFHNVNVPGFFSIDSHDTNIMQYRLPCFALLSILLAQEYCTGP